MMTDDVRAAVSRFRGGYYTEDEAAVDQDYKDMRTLAAAYLAEHPEDEHEPVTAEWLEAAGWIDMGGDLRSPAGDTPWALWWNQPRPWSKGSRWCVSFPGMTANLGYDLPTRGAVRRLLAALGLEVRG